MFFSVIPVEQPGQESHEDVAHQLGPCQSVLAEEAVQDEEHRDIDHEPAHDDQEECHAALSQGLEKVDINKAQEHHDRRQDPDAQKIRAQSHGGGILDEDPDQVGREELIEGDTADTDRYACGTGGVQYILHAPVVFRGVIVGCQGHHAQAESDADVEGQSLRLEDNANGGQRYIAVGGHQAVQDDVVKVKEEGTHGGGDADAEKGCQKRSAGQTVLERKMQDGIVQPQNGDHKIGTGKGVGQGSGKTCTQNLMARRQQHEHKDGIHDDIDDSAHGDGESSLFGTADISQQISHGHGCDRGCTSEDDHAGAVLPCKFIGLAAGPQKCQQGMHEDGGHDREKQPHKGGKPDAEGGNAAGALGLPCPHQPGDQSPAACSRDVRDRNADIKDRQDQRRACHHIGIVGSSYIEGVRHVVDQHDQLRDHRGHSHSRKGFGNRHLFKEITVFFFLQMYL